MNSWRQRSINQVLHHTKYDPDAKIAGKVWWKFIIQFTTYAGESNFLTMMTIKARDMLMMAKDKQIIFHLRTSYWKEVWAKMEQKRKYWERLLTRKKLFSRAVLLNHFTTRFWFPQINTQFASVIASKCFNLIWVKDWAVESESNWIKSVNNFICCNQLCAR